MRCEASTRREARPDGKQAQQLPAASWPCHHPLPPPSAHTCASPVHLQPVPIMAALFLWAPNVNPFRDPRWGRGQEVPPGESLVCAEIAAAYISALQGETAEGFLKTVATVKHFFDYDQEVSPT